MCRTISTVSDLGAARPVKLPFPTPPQSESEAVDRLGIGLLDVLEVVLPAPDAVGELGEAGRVVALGEFPAGGEDDGEPHVVGDGPGPHGLGPGVVVVAPAQDAGRRVYHGAESSLEAAILNLAETGHTK